MAVFALLVGGAWLAFCAAGWIVAGWLPAEHRTRAQAFAPVIGGAAWVALLYDLTLFVSMSTGVWIAAALFLALAGVRTWRDHRWFMSSWSAVGWLGAGAVVGVIASLMCLTPLNLTHDSRPVQVTLNFDAAWYVNVENWLTDHRAIDAPVYGLAPGPDIDAPSTFTAWQQYENPNRVGQELVAAALTSAAGREPIEAWYPFTYLWVLLMPAAGIGVARFWRFSPVVGLVFGALSAVSFHTTWQLAEQNSDSIAGMVVAPLAVAAVAAAFTRKAWTPLWLTALLLTALIGTYFEFVALVAPALVVAVLARAPRRIPSALRSAWLIVAMAIAMAPLAWLRAYRMLTRLFTGPADQHPAVFSHVSPVELVNRFVGVADLESGAHLGWLGVLLAGGIVVGVAGALVLSRARLTLATLVAVGVWLGYLAGAQERNYLQMRIVEIWVPLLLMVVVIGWVRLWRWFRDRQTRWVRLGAHVVTAVAVVLASLWPVANVATAKQLDWKQAAKSRHVTSDFADAVQWVHELGGPDGSDTMVLVTEYFNQLWLASSLRHERLVSYPSLYASYEGRARFFDGRLRRYLLIDKRAIIDAPAAKVVRQNARFRLLDLSGGDYTVVGGGSDQFPGTFVVLRSTGAPDTIQLVGILKAAKAASLPQLDPEIVSLPVPPGEISKQGQVAIVMNGKSWLTVRAADAKRMFIPSKITGPPAK